MSFSKSEAVETMNTWGAQRIPFLFIIDFTMMATEVFRLDHPIPPSIASSFGGSSQHKALEKNNSFVFRKHPVPFAQYQKAFNLVQKEIQAGNSFLVNLTFPTQLETNLTLKEIFHISSAPYKLLYDGRFVCFSPETFIKISNNEITTFPMKGTINANIPDAKRILLESRKEMAEHSTVVDLLRNDLSMVASDVRVIDFRYVDVIDSHQGSILQVSSAIRGKLGADYNKNIGTILFTLLPAGSVTGAPKPRTLEIIKRVEPVERGFYTGIFGMFDGRDLDSAVMIRFIEIQNGCMVYRSGGGITALSNAVDEYTELLEKIYVPIA